MVFALHPQLAADTILVGELAVCRVLLMNNRHFPWLILVPRRENRREIFELSDADYAGMMQEVRDTAKTFAALTGAHKMNIAALGNMVPQLHIHIIARYAEDKAWPNSVWNAGIAGEAYAAQEAASLIEKLKTALL